MNTQNVTIEQLAERFGTTVWSKGDLKRIYLNDEGYNTKKMSTKTFIFEKDGEFIVSCRIECPSQAYQWIQSQEEEVKQSIYSRIENALSETAYILVDNNGKMVNWKKEEVALNDATSFFTESEAIAEIDNCGYFSSFITMPRDEFEKEVEKLNEIYRKERDAKKAEELKNLEPTNKNYIKTFEVGEDLNHATWGTVIVVSEDENTVTVDKQGEHKKLLKKFAPLTRP